MPSVFSMIVVAALSMTARGQNAVDLALIPQPASAERRAGEFCIKPAAVICATGEAQGVAQQLVAALKPAMRVPLTVRDGSPATNAIVLTLDRSLKSDLGTEGYRLRVLPDRVDLRAAEPAGLFYGTQTLRQLLPPQVFSPTPVDDVDWRVPCVTVTDRPRFGWRGLLIDPARHFIPVDDVKRYIDIMAVHKFNRLQMHLTDNIGWRVEIKKYPDLTKLASNRDRSGGRGGFYTQEDIRELVRYASIRHVTIVPEIEMPYHAGAAINAYPRLGIRPSRVSGMSLDERWGKLGGLVAPRPETVSFLQDVLSEIIELFPSRFIHIGGDEANLQLWENDPELKSLMKELGCRDAHALHSWFIKQMDAFLARHGRRLLGWDEILQGGLAPGATVMSWRGIHGGITAAQAGHDVVMAPTSHTYFDYRQAPEEKGLGRRVINLEKAYAFEPIPDELTATQIPHVLGGQGQLWGELIPDEARREFMTYPRACALAEALWSPKERRDFGEFLDRLEHHLERLDEAAVNYRRLDKPILPVGDATQAGGAQAARGLAARLLGDRAAELQFEPIPPPRGRDVFEIESRNGNTVIRGNNGVAMATGLNWYLKHYCHCHVSWCGDQLSLPSPLPEVGSKVRRVAWARYRYFLNYCCFGYSLPWYDWSQWERLIDWMALHGVNAPLAATGQEAVWKAVCRRLGMTETQVADFLGKRTEIAYQRSGTVPIFAEALRSENGTVPFTPASGVPPNWVYYFRPLALAGPPYLPFQWMGCLDGWGGPLPDSWIERHEELQKRILSRQRELGMTPVLQGFTGHVPAASATQYPDAKLHEIAWLEWKTHLVDPASDPGIPGRRSRRSDADSQPVLRIEANRDFPGWRRMGDGSRSSRHDRPIHGQRLPVPLHGATGSLHSRHTNR